jgi:hypothetical protein
MAQDIAETFAKKDEKLLARAAAVLAGQGLYAFAVHLKNEATPKAVSLLVGSGNLIGFLDSESSSNLTVDDTIKLIQRTTVDLQKLLLAKRMVSEMLTYLKYHVRAKPDQLAKTKL